MVFKDNQTLSLIVFWDGGGRAQRRLSWHRRLCVYIHIRLFCIIRSSFRGGCKGSDEERSTWSGGTITKEWATSRLAQGSVGSVRMTITSSEPQPHIFYFSLIS